jgi:hypothetical protein
MRFFYNRERTQKIKIEIEGERMRFFYNVERTKIIKIEVEGNE